MSCTRCQGLREAIARTFGGFGGPPPEPSPVDPEFALPERTQGNMGPRLLPPAGFEKARVCLECGTVYCPRTLPEVPREG